MGQWTVAREGSVAVLAIDDGKANAITTVEFESLARALDEIEKSDASAVVMTGRPGFFSAGLNLKVLPTLTAPQMQALVTRFGEVLVQLFLFPRPVVAAMSGHAIAGGALLALACDVRLFAEGPFRFGLNEVPGGIFLPQFAVELMRAACPAEYLVEQVLHGRMLSPTEAKERRLVEAVVAPEALMAAAIARATALGDLAGNAYAITKMKLRGPAADYSVEQVGAEVDALGRALGGG